MKLNALCILQRKHLCLNGMSLSTEPEVLQAVVYEFRFKAPE
jgi:hypothetical protein